MLKKRIIFSLIYADGQYCQSRNFRLQRVGDLRWLIKNYNFDNIAQSIDELVIVDASRHNRNSDRFFSDLNIIRDHLNIPIAAGGGLLNFDGALKLFQAGADKLVINTASYMDSNLLRNLSEAFGRQAIILSVDFMRIDDALQLSHSNGSILSANDLDDHLLKTSGYSGEILFNSIDRDGTGFGLDLESLKTICSGSDVPIIAMGGVGAAKHMHDALKIENCGAVCTANLFNFVGDGLMNARKQLIDWNINLARW